MITSILFFKTVLIIMRYAPEKFIQSNFIQKKTKQVPKNPRYELEPNSGRQGKRHTKKKWQNKIQKG